MNIVWQSPWHCRALHTPGYNFLYTKKRYRTNFKRKTRGVGRREEGAGKVKGHEESDKEEVQESRDTGEKIEHPWGPVNQLVYSLLRTNLGDFQGLGEFICCSERRLAISKPWCRVTSQRQLKWNESWLLWSDCVSDHQFDSNAKTAFRLQRHGSRQTKFTNTKNRREGVPKKSSSWRW